MDTSFVGELGEVPGATVLTVQSVMHSGSQVELGLQVHHVSETKIDTMGLEKGLSVKIVRPK